ncbi:MAG: SDR family NAD(P)-dependent oxidoreductase [Chloroflexi bacterium]|nr:SDR family NAD(P)-dependent oxidoreductase [Chloroflexota bacterium]
MQVFEALHGSSCPVAIVTGASSGIGRETALLLGRRGYCVGLLARRLERLEQVAEEVIAAGGAAAPLPTDVASRVQVNRAVEAIVRRWGRVDLLVNNAGFGVYGLVSECEPADFERQVQVNYLGAVYCTLAALPTMLQQESGCIINVSSISGKVPSPLSAGYCASKSALGAFSAALRMELRGRGVSVVTVCPGYSEGEFDEAMVKRRPLERRNLLRPVAAASVARTIVRAAERPRRELVTPSALRLLALGYHVMPGLIDWWQSKFRNGPGEARGDSDG